MFGLPRLSFLAALLLGLLSLLFGRLLDWSWRDSLFAALWTMGVILLAWRTVLRRTPLA